MNAGPLAHPSGTYAIGAASYARRLELQEGRAIPLDLYERVGARALAATKAEFVATAAKIDPAKTPAQVYADLGKQHPAADKLLATAQDELAALRAFVERKHLVTLAPEFDVRVRETPLFNRQTSFASMNTPGAFEKVATQAYYYISPPEPTWTPAQQEQHLSFFNDFALPIVSAHEVMPGHYVNFVLHKYEKLSLVRALSGNPSYSEGWAHYDEQMMVDEGWGDGDPRVRLAQLALALQREARYLVGLREHTQGMTVDQGTAFFVDNAFMPEIAARREALRGTQDPLYGYYTLGKLEILKLRDDYRKKLGAAYTLQKFHDAFLAHGNPPIGDRAQAAARRRRRRQPVVGRRLGRGRGCVLERRRAAADVEDAFVADRVEKTAHDERAARAQSERAREADVPVPSRSRGVPPSTYGSPAIVITVPGFAASALAIVSGGSNVIALSTTMPKFVPSIATRTVYRPGASARRSSVVESTITCARRRSPGGTSSWRVIGIGLCPVTDDQTGASSCSTSTRNRSAVGKRSRTM